MAVTFLFVSVFVGFSFATSSTQLKQNDDFILDFETQKFVRISCTGHPTKLKQLDKCIAQLSLDEAQKVRKEAAEDRQVFCSKGKPLWEKIKAALREELQQSDKEWNRMSEAEKEAANKKIAANEDRRSQYRECLHKIHV